MKVREFKGTDKDLLPAGRGRVELPETVALRELMEDSATKDGKRMEVLLDDPDDEREVKLTKQRIRAIATKHGYSISMRDTADSIVVAATFKEQPVKAEAEAEEEEEKDAEAEVISKLRSVGKGTTRRTTRKATAGATR